MALLCLLCCMRIGIQADTGKSLVIEKNNGAKTTFLLSESPELTFANRSLKVTVNGKNTIFLIDDVSQYYFEITAPNTITPLQTSDLRICYSSSQTLIIDGVNMPAAVSIHAIDGKAYPANVRVANGRAEISISQLPTGIYIISINNQQLKFYKK